jgi:hypothetical protein
LERCLAMAMRARRRGNGRTVTRVG